MSTVVKATTTKQKADQRQRYKNNQAERRRANTVYGALTYRCSHCENTIRVHEEMGERKILCSKCSQGFFTQLLKDDRKHLAKPGDFGKPKRRGSSRKKR